MDIDLRNPNWMSRFADAHRIEAKAVDGNDVVAISNLSKYAIKRARTNKSPFFIEAITYRWRGHVGPNIDLDVGVRRSQSELLTWMKRDPIERLKVAILQRKQSLLKNMIEIEQKVNADIEEAVSFARSSDLPKAKDLMDFLFPRGDFKMANEMISYGDAIREGFRYFLIVTLRVLLWVKVFGVLGMLETQCLI